VKGVRVDAIIVSLIALFAVAHPSIGAPLSNEVFVALDLETTGFSSKRDRIVEIGAIRFGVDGIAVTNSWLINPGMPIPASAERVHGISDKMVAKAPSFGSVYPEIKEFIGVATLLAHNAGFDVRFLAAECSRAGVTLLDNRYIDTLGLFRKWFPEAAAHNLSFLSEHLGVYKGGHHRAVNDAECVRRIFLIGLTRNREDSI